MKRPALFASMLIALLPFAAQAAEIAHASGSIAIAEQGATANVKFSGTTAEGVKLEGAVDCKSVLKGR